MDTEMKSAADRSDGSQQQSYMIPGVDGKLQFAFPKKIKTILRYFQNDLLTSNSGSIVSTIFRMNSLFDPDVTGTGHQPLYFDRYAALYNNYRVLGSRITTTFSPTHENLGAVNGPYVIGMRKAKSVNLLASSLVGIQEQNDTVVELINHNDMPQSLSMTYSPAIDMGRLPEDETIGAAVTANPQENYHVSPFFTDRTNAVGSTCYLQTVIEFTVEFYNLQLENES